MAKIKIKKGDKVRVVAGENKGLEGEILGVLTNENKVIVEGINLVKKHLKPSVNNPQGGISETESPIHVSNVALLDGKGNPTRVGYRFENGKKIRFAKTTNDAI